MRQRWIAARYLRELGVSWKRAEVRLLAKLGGWEPYADREPGRDILSRGLSRLVEARVVERVLEGHRHERERFPPRIAASFGGERIRIPARITLSFPILLHTTGARKVPAPASLRIRTIETTLSRARVRRSTCLSHRNALMSIRSAASQPSSSSAPPRRIMEVLYRSLVTALVKQCAQRHDANVSVRRLKDTSDDPSEMHLRLDCRGLLQMPVRLVAMSTSANIYEVRCTLEDGSSRQFSYGLSGRSGTNLSPAPQLGRKLATFLLDELEKRLGRLLLQSPMRPPTQATLFSQ